MIYLLDLRKNASFSSFPRNKLFPFNRYLNDTVDSFVANAY